MTPRFLKLSLQSLSSTLCLCLAPTLANAQNKLPAQAQRTQSIIIVDVIIQKQANAFIITDDVIDLRQSRTASIIIGDVIFQNTRNNGVESVMRNRDIAE